MTEAKYEIKEVPGCTQFLVYDTTGLYSSQNPGGWDDGNHLDSSNPAITDVDTCVLDIYRSDGSTVQYNLYSDGTTTVAFPNTDGAYKLIEDTGALGGIVRMRMTITGADINGAEGTGFTIYKDCDFLFMCKYECCIAKLGAQLNIKSIKDCAPCSDKKQAAFYEASDILLAVRQQFKNQDFNAVTVSLERLDQICTENYCNC